MRLLSRESNGKQRVYDLYVYGTHNFTVNGGIVVHNCDALRYWAIYWTRPNDRPDTPATVRWTDDQIEDYYNASQAEREMLIKKWGKPKNL